MSRPDPIRRGLLAICLGLVLGGCAAPAYYWQAIEGQLELWQRSRPIAALTLDPEITPAIKGKLATVLRIRDFASQELVLPSNGSYRKYADIRRSYVVWNVFAAEEFSVTTKQWCFPVAGCVSYRGYFSEESARAYAAQLRDEGYDVHVGGVPAYSTLGWFDDPVLNTFIHYPETELARLIFHELAHQVAYVQDDSEFNESFAVAVELEGIQRWLSRFGNDAQRASFEVMQRYRSDFYALVLKYRERLAQAYAVQATVQAKREHKARILGELQEEYRMIKSERWGGFSGFDRWFGQSINNATLASVGIYHQLVPAFQALLTNNGDDLGRFYEAVRDLASVAKPERQRRLAHALEQGRRSKLATGEPNGESLGLGSR
jgi:predicted aminopeptidase